MERKEVGSFLGWVGKWAVAKWVHGHLRTDDATRQKPKPSTIREREIEAEVVESEATYLMDEKDLLSPSNIF